MVLLNESLSNLRFFAMTVCRYPF